MWRHPMAHTHTQQDMGCVLGVIWSIHRIHSTKYNSSSDLIWGLMTESAPNLHGNLKWIGNAVHHHNFHSLMLRRLSLGAHFKMPSLLCGKSQMWKWECLLSHVSCLDKGNSHNKLSYLPLDKMAAISQAIFSNAFSWMKSFVFWFKFH